MKTAGQMFWIVVGAVVGGLIGHTVADQLLTPFEDVEFEDGDEFDDPVEIEVSDWSLEREELPKSVSTEEEEVDNEEIKGSKKRKRNRRDKEEIDYAKFAEINRSKPPLKSIVSEEFADLDVSKEPFVIRREDSIKETNKNAKMVLTYYSIDEVLVNEEDERIHNPEELIGPDAFERFGQGSDDIDVVYVRNPSKKIDYEVVRLEKSYNDTIVMPEVVAKKKRKNGNAPH